jgi:hypothetical protein
MRYKINILGVFSIALFFAAGFFCKELISTAHAQENQELIKVLAELNQLEKCDFTKAIVRSYDSEVNIICVKK